MTTLTPAAPVGALHSAAAAFAAWRAAWRARRQAWARMWLHARLPDHARMDIGLPARAEQAKPLNPFYPWL